MAEQTEEQTENEPIKRKLYIPLILMPNKNIFDIGIAFSREFAEWDLNQSWDRLSAERKAKFTKLVKEIELEL